MKIGIDARFWNQTGVGRYIRNLVAQLQRFDKNNHYTLFVSKNDYAHIITENSWLNTNERWKIIVTDIPWHSLKEQIRFPVIINQQNLDLMHFPYFSIPIFYNKPFIVTIHDLILHHFPSGEATTKSKIIYQGKLLSYKVIIKTAAQKARKIIAVSQATKDEIIEHLHVPSQKVEVIYEGVSFETNARSVVPQTLMTKLSSSTYFLHVGNLYPHKNTKILLQAFSQLKKHFPQIQLVIVGKQDFFQKRLFHQVEVNNLSNNIQFLGEVTDTELSYLYTHAQALISPSVMEGFDLPSVEAMAHNCPVIASDIPVHREICQNAALYFESNNSKDLMLKLTQILKTDKKALQGNIQSGKKIVKQYSWETMAKETIKIYESSTSV
jgi:glycosyltransferase involved in cell wall biosynthesis